MPGHQLYPLTFTPIYKGYPWGGRQLAARYGRRGLPEVCAESWEISERPGAVSVVNQGPLCGRTLSELRDDWGTLLIGRAAPAGRFPLLIKLIDARERLSLQVHPAVAVPDPAGGEPKTEMWVVLDGTPGAQVFAGLREGVTAEEFTAGLAAGPVEDLLAALPVQAGEAIFIPGGLVHAIDAGCLLLEVQQNSDTTYRLHDWGRVDPAGRPRALHVAQGLATIDWQAVAGRMSPAPAADGVHEICRCAHFRVLRRRLVKTWAAGGDGLSFQAVFVASGQVRATGGGVVVDLAPGTSCLLPAGLDECRLTPISSPPMAEIIQVML